MLLIVTPDIMAIYERYRICAHDLSVVDEHREILAALKLRDGLKAADLMRKHLNGVLEFAKSNLV